MRFWIAPHLAFLVQWLRVLGIDVRLWDKGVILGQEEETVVQWVRYPLPLEGIRINIITLLESTRETLMKEFFEILGIQPGFPQMFKRCLRCNDLLFPINHEEAKQKWPEIPEYVLRTQKSFNWCERCRKVFWAGTHVRNMIRTLENWGLIPKDPRIKSSTLEKMKRDLIIKNEKGSIPPGFSFDELVRKG